jgi:hypothetical protein
MELLLVMGLLALLMGAGVGMLSSINLGRRAAVGLVQSVVRAAHNSAVARNAPARVRIDVPTGTMRAEAMAVIGTWHFESERLEGAFEINGVLESGSIVDDGYIGRALTFSPTAGRTPAAEFPVHQDASYDLSLGFAIECVVRVDGKRRRQAPADGRHGRHRRHDGTRRQGVVRARDRRPEWIDRARRQGRVRVAAGRARRRTLDARARAVRPPAPRARDRRRRGAAPRRPQRSQGSGEGRRVEAGDSARESAPPTTSTRATSRRCGASRGRWCSARRSRASRAASTTS